MVGMEKKEFVYDVTFPEKTNDDHAFVEQLWARRKVGFMLDQIRANGEKQELVNEVTALAKKYGITTPYTSYLIVPDAAVPVAQGRSGRQAERGVQRTAARPRRRRPWRGGFGAAAAGGKPISVEEFAKRTSRSPATWRSTAAPTPSVNWTRAATTRAKRQGRRDAKDKKAAYDPARELLARTAAGRRPGRQAGRGSVAARRPTCATSRGWIRRPSRTYTAAIAWSSAASGSTRASTPRCRP